MTSTREEKMTDAFLVIGSQYYALAAYCSEHMYLPVGVTLFHHAIEMLLKGILSKRMSSAELKKIGHNLEQLWKEIKSEIPDNRFSKYDMTIEKLNKVELIRYPDLIVDKGYVLSVRLGSPTPIDIPGTENLPQYQVNVTDLYEIASLMFEVFDIPINPYFKNTPPEIVNPMCRFNR